jgi:cytochrome c peroxidase
MKSKILLAALIIVNIIGLGVVIYLVWPQPETQDAMLHQGPMGPGMRMGRQGMTANETAVKSHDWTAEEVEILRSLWIGSLPPLPPDPSNQYADDPHAAALGQALFFDPRLSSNGQVSCSSCHIPEMMFTDGRTLAVGIGVNNRKTMTIVGTAYSPWQFWDGRADSQWAQALGPR